MITQALEVSQSGQKYTKRFLGVMQLGRTIVDLDYETTQPQTAALHVQEYVVSISGVDHDERYRCRQKLTKCHCSTPIICCSLPSYNSSPDEG